MCSNPSCNGNRRDKVALRTTCIKNVKFKIIKIRTGCQYRRTLLLQATPELGRTSLRLGRGSDIADLMEIKEDWVQLGGNIRPGNFF